MNFDWNSFYCVIAVVITLVAIVSPVITAIINNCHQTKIKKLDMYENEKRLALSNFIKACEDFISSGELVSSKLWSNYYSSINQLFIYFDIADYSIFSQLEETVKKRNVFNSHHELANIVVTLSKQIAKA